MEKHWLRNRLTQAKQSSELWTELADAIQNIVEYHAIPLVERLRNLSSAFTMEPVDIDKKISELGRFFTIRAVNDELKPIVLTQRLDEIHLKDTQYPVVNTLWREFRGLPVTWQPLYAPIDQKKYPYGTLLLTKESAEAAGGRYGNMFLTSRGVIRLPINELVKDPSYQDNCDLDEVLRGLIAELKLYIEPLLPLHIVFDGHELELKYTLTEADEWFYAISWTIGQDAAIDLLEGLEKLAITKEDIASGDGPIRLGGSIGHRDFILHFDEIPLDAWTLDSNYLPFYFEREMEFSIEDHSETDIRICAENKKDTTIVTKEGLEVLQPTSTHLGEAANAMPTLSERVESMIRIATSGQEQCAIADKKEVFKRLNDELRNSIAQREGKDGIAMTITELEDMITEINRQMEHAGYELRFDVTPLDQCMLDSGHFEP